MEQQQTETTEGIEDWSPKIKKLGWLDALDEEITRHGGSLPIATIQKYTDRGFVTVSKYCQLLVSKGIAEWNEDRTVITIT